MLDVHRSNRADRLVEVLADRLAGDPLADPLQAEQVAVQSRGMQRWLSHQLAERLGAGAHRDGICANVAFPFPARVLHEVVTAALGEAPRADAWSPDRLVWPVLDALGTTTGDPAFGLVDGYLRGADVVDRRTYGLARRVADVFDRYAMFRPAMVRRWGAGDDTGPDGQALPASHRWQPILWRELEDRLGSGHLANRFADAVAALRDPSVPTTGLPARISMFGTGALPPAYLDVLVALADRIDVALYIVAPSRALWQATTDAAPGGADATHPLLASCGRLARDFQAVLVDTATGLDGQDRFHDPATADDPTLLACLQSDLLADLDRGGPVPADRADDPAVVAARPAAVPLADDRSVQLHACHGPARQVEVLHDALLHLLEDTPDLEPRDVLVMTPDIEAYAPLVTAVFGDDGTDHTTATRPTVPYRLADRTLRRTNPLASALLAVLELADGRVEASAVLDLLGRPPVRERFRISEDAVGRIHRWVADSGIRWGIDGDHRAAHGQPDERHHTWRQGLDRLLVGVTMADQDDRLVGDVVPHDDMEGDRVELLDRFVGFTTTLFATLAQLHDPRPVTAWADTLAEVVDGLLAASGRDAWYLDQLRAALAGLVEASRDADGTASDRLLGLDAVRRLVADAGSDRGATAGYETGAVTFCAMIPMRSIPHRVVCLLGMDDGAFPRTRRPMGFDLLATHHQLGDRDPRDEDRLLFLEAILAARDRLVITYTGRDQRTNEARAPAVPVGELLDVIDRAVTRDDGQPAASRRLTTEHPLQAFSPRNFTTTDTEGRPVPPLSFDTGQLAAARMVRTGGTDAWRFLAEPLPPPDGDDDLVEFGDLRRFLRHPIQWLFTQRLGMWLRERHDQVDDTEPIETDNLGGWAIGQALLEARLDDRDLARWARASMARGTIPVGTLGRYEVAKVEPVVDEIVARVLDHPRPDVADAHRGQPPLPIDVAVGDRRLVGAVGGVRDGLLVQAQYTTIKAKHRLEMWLTHLALSAAHPDAGLQCLLVGRGDKQAVTSVTFRPVGRDAAVEHLATLVRLYRRGQCQPLPLFETASAAYARRILAAEGTDTSDHDAHAAAVRAARQAWEPNDKGWGGDRVDDHVVQCYGDGCRIETILDHTDFAELALTVWRPLLAAEVQT